MLITGRKLINLHKISGGIFDNFLSLKMYNYCFLEVSVFSFFFISFLYYLNFLTRTYTIYRTQGKGKAVSLTTLYHFHPLHRNLDINRTITAESSPLHIASRQPRAQVVKHKATHPALCLILSLIYCLLYCIRLLPFQLG